MLNSTVLNADFVVSETNKVDISALANDYINEVPPNQLPAEAKTSLSQAVTKLEPKIKQQIGAAIYPTYDYVLGRSQNIELALVLNNSILNSDFLASLVNELDIASWVKQFVATQFNVPSGLPVSKDTVMQYINQAIVKSEPQIKQQINAAIPPTVDYLLGKSQSLNATISLQPIIDNLKDIVKKDPQLSAIPPALIDQLFNQLLVQLGIPSTIGIDKILGDLSEVRTQVSSGLTSAKQALDQARGYLRYFDIAFWGLIGLTILLIVGIILINRQVKASTRGIGIIFLIYGILEFGGIYLAKYLIQPQLAQLNAPANLQALIPQFLDDIVRPLQIFSLTILIVGIVLIIISHVYKRRQTTTA